MKSPPTHPVPSRFRPTGSSTNFFRWLVTATGILLLVPATTGFIQDFHPWFALIIALFVALQVNFPLTLFQNELDFVQVICLGGGLLYGGGTAGWGVTTGFFLGHLIRGLRVSSSTKIRARPAVNWLQAGFASGMNNIALMSALWASGLMGGLVNSPGEFDAIAMSWLIIAAIIIYILLHYALFLIDTRLKRPGKPDHSNSVLYRRRDWVLLSLTELLPLPFVAIAVASYPASGMTAVLALGAIPLIIAILIYNMNKTRADLERRLQELSSLQQVSQVLRMTLDLDRLLSVIQAEVSRLLGVDNFYVALLDPGKRRIWYPLAVKNGRRQDWPSRPLMDRLTDRVIINRKAINYATREPGSPDYIDLPPSEVMPSAWIGVPLISSNRTIGCLALFSVETGASFTKTDLDLLTLLSGQISVGIENALLFEQTQRRAAQLDTLNQLSALIAASLDPQEVLAQVCRSVTQVGGNRSAIYMLDQEAGQVWLAHAYELSAEFIEAGKSFSLSQDARTRCLRTGRPVLSSDINEVTLQQGYIQALRREGIAAFGDFPLIAPEGQIGFLSVYFDKQHSFDAEQTELLQTFASHAALAVSNARLHAQTDMALSQRAHQLAILEAVGRELAAATHSDKLFKMILGYAREFTDSPWGGIGLYRPAENQIEVKAIYGYEQQLESFPVDAGITGRAIRTKQAVNLGDISQDSDYIDLSGGKARSQLCIPLIHEGRVLGALTLENPEVNGYTTGEQAFISQLANQAAIALVNSELYTDATLVRDRLAAVLNSVREGIIMLEASGQIAVVNQVIPGMTGLEISELRDRRLADLEPQKLRLLGYSPQKARELLSALQAGQTPIDSAFTFRLGDSLAERILERTLLPVWGSRARATDNPAQTGQAIGCMIVLRDVTEEHQIAQTREMITETLVHDLRSPLAAVLGALDIIESSATEPESIQQGLHGQALRVARSAARRVLGLVESLLDISRMQTGHMELNLEPVDLSLLVVEALADYVPQASEYGIILRNEVSPGFPKVYADRIKTGRVLVNLLDNALKFTPSGGQVIFSADQDPADMVTLRVSDSGPGVPIEFREKIFERFSQVPGLKGRRRGAGLGLTFCKLAVEAQGGRIWVEARVEGGSSFAFTLPTVGSVNLS